jgi:hypothetical protein
MKIRHSIIVLGILGPLYGFYIHVWLTERSECGTIHRPATGCPQGFREIPDIFEYQGNKEAACYDAHREDCIDVLRPEERMRFALMPFNDSE